MLAANKGVAYLDEPFRPDQRPGLFSAGVTNWFAYWKDCDEDLLTREYERLLRLRYSFARELVAVESLRDVLRMMRDGGRVMLQRMFAERVLIKDPLAALSSAWIADRFEADVVVMVRHPAAFANSLKERGWSFPFGQLLERPRLMQDHLAEYAEQIRAFRDQDRSVVEQAGLLWFIIYRVLAEYIEEHPGWIVRRLDDVARKPVESFSELYEVLGLEFTDGCRQVVVEHSKSTNPVEARGGPMDIRRDSRGLVGRWKTALTREEILTVYDLTSEVASRWYTSQSWSSK